MAAPAEWFFKNALEGFPYFIITGKTDSGCPDCSALRKQPPDTRKAHPAAYKNRIQKKNATSGRTAAQPRRVSLTRKRL